MTYKAAVEKAKRLSQANNIGYFVYFDFDRENYQIISERDYNDNLPYVLESNVAAYIAEGHIVEAYR